MFSVDRMQRRDEMSESCSIRSAPQAWSAQSPVELVQRFPTDGLLADNLNLSLASLTIRVRKVPGRTYSYIVRTVKLDRPTLRFQQRGSAPNFQGGLLTLCTCKHQMRSSLTASEWEQDVWVAGFTSRCRYRGKHWLFCLTKVDAAYESHSDLWMNLPLAVRRAKEAHRHPLGDIYKPTTAKLAESEHHQARNYHEPAEHHVHSGRQWHNDVKYRHATKFGHPALLVGDPALTFLWEKPVLALNGHHCRNYRKWMTLEVLLSQVKQASR
jgi:hypothetical protein